MNSAVPAKRTAPAARKPRKTAIPAVYPPSQSLRKIQFVIHPAYRAKMQPGHCRSWVPRALFVPAGNRPSSPWPGEGLPKIMWAGQQKRAAWTKASGKTRTPAHTALVVLASESQLLITRCLLFSCGSSVGYDLQFLESKMSSNIFNHSYFSMRIERIASMQASVSLSASFSQICKGIHPFARSSWSTRASRAMFSSIFWIQYSLFLFKRDFRCSQSFPCQNSPSTKIATWYLVMAISGEPGNRLSFLR